MSGAGPERSVIEPGSPGAGGDEPGAATRPPVAEAVSEAEARFERGRRLAGLVLAPVLGPLVWALGPPGAAGRLAGLLAFVATLWISEAIPVAATALLAGAAVVILGIAPAREAFASFGHPLLFLFVGSFLIAEAMKVHGLGERFARALARVARTPRGAIVALSLAAFLLSLWISNTAATAVTLPIALSLAERSRDRRFGAALVLAIAYGASVGGIGTPVGTPPNLIGLGLLREQAGVDLGFFRWMAIGLPIGAVMLALLWGLLALRFRLAREPLDTAGARPGPLSRGEVAVAVAFVLAGGLWILPGVLDVAGARGATAFLKARLPEEIVALLAATLLFVWPTGRGTRALSWEQAARIDWGTILLFGAGILLGDLAGKTGLAARWGDALVDATGASSLWGITALVTAVAIVLSESTSNTATATLMIPMTLSLATAAGVSPVPPALGATLGASFGFMLPISTAPNAMAYGTGKVSIRQMMGAGVLFDVLGFVVIVLGLRLLCPLLGLA